MKDIRPTRRGSTAHELTRVIVLAKSDRMTQLVRHDVATDAGKPQWRALKVTDSDETFVSLLEGLAKETKAPSDSAIIKSPSICMKPDGRPTNALCPSSVA
jgi:hypothetical protein